MQGTIMMQGTIRKRGKNSWQLIFDLPRGADGNRHQARHTVHGTTCMAPRGTPRPSCVNY